MSRLRATLLVVAVLVIAANLRPAVVTVSPLIDQIRADEGISSTVAGLLTTLPVLCFGLLAPVAPRLTRRVGLEVTLLIALGVLTVGVLVRLVPSLVALLAGSVLAGAAIATGNTLMPTLVKRDFPHRVGPMTGAYSTTLGGAGALAAGAMVPIQHATGLSWRPALALWAIFVVLAIALWTPSVVRAVRARRAEPAAASAPVRGLARSPLAWQVTLLMGLQSLHYYALVAWIPTLFVDAGASPTTAGLLLSVTGVASLPASYVIPVLAARRPTQHHLVVVAYTLIGVGYLGVLLAPMAVPWLWMALLGLGQGAALSLSLMIITLRSPDAAHTAQLSAMAQGVGYVIAACGPFVLGAVHDATGGWTVPMIVMLVALAPLFVVGFGAARNRHVGLPAPAPAEAPDGAGTPPAPGTPASVASAAAPVDAAADPERSVRGAVATGDGGARDRAPRAAADGAGSAADGASSAADGAGSAADGAGSAAREPILRGHVRRPDGTAVAGAVVTLVDADGRDLGHAGTDDDGAYTLRAPDAPAILVCSAADHAPVARRAVPPGPGLPLDVELRPQAPRPPRSPHPQGPALTG